MRAIFCLLLASVGCSAVGPVGDEANELVDDSEFGSGGLVETDQPGTQDGSGGAVTVDASGGAAVTGGAESTGGLDSSAGGSVPVGTGGEDGSGGETAPEYLESCPGTTRYLKYVPECAPGGCDSIVESKIFVVLPCRDGLGSPTNLCFSPDESWGCCCHPVSL
jgi:hypothetical protein